MMETKGWIGTLEEELKKEGYELLVSEPKKYYRVSKHHKARVARAKAKNESKRR